MWFNKVARKDYSIGLNTTGNGVDDPDQTYFEHYACKSERNYVGYCNPEIEKLFPIQSAERDIEKRKKLVWEIDKQILEEGFRPIIMWNASGSCWHPHVKGIPPDGEQPLQRLALRGRLARQVSRRQNGRAAAGGPAQERKAPGTTLRGGS